MVQAVGSGIVCWSPQERRSQRYGGIYLANVTLQEDVRCVHRFDPLDAFVGRRVRLECRITGARNSSHVGDSFLNILPSIPQLGEIFDLGVGILRVETDSYHELYPLGTSLLSCQISNIS